MLALLLLASLLLNAGSLGVALAAGADNLAAATALTTPLANDTSDTTGATRDTGEIGGGQPGCNFPSTANTHSVWYRYAAGATGWLALDTFGSSYDTVLEVFSGSASPTFATLTSLACNDDSAGLRQSALALPVASGTFYYAVVRSYNGGPGGTLKFSASFSTQLDMYVNQTTGNDSNPGTAALPVKTIQRAVSLVPASSATTVNIHVPAGGYSEAVTINKTLTFVVPSGAATTSSFTLQSGANVTLPGGGTISAPAVTVESGAIIQQGIGLVEAGGTVRVKGGTYAENLTIAKSLTLRNFDATLPVIDPASGNAITISAGTTAMTGLTIQGAVNGVNITGGANHTIYRNNITTNTSGVANATGSNVNALENFWGNATGPTHATNPGGTGDSISNNVAYRPWCTAPAPTCLPRAGAATRLRFTSSPGNTPAGAAFAAQPVVQAEDDLGNVDTTFTGTISVTIKANTGTSGATLGGTLSVSAVNGIATFTGLNINYVGQSYQLGAASGALNSSATGDGAAFNITADRLVFSVSPSDSTASVAFATQPVVRAEDGFGHVDSTFTGAIALAIKAGSGTAGAALGGTASTSAVAGVATYTGLSIDKVGTAYRLSASASSLTGADSAPFNIGAGAATQLAFNPSPSDSTGGTPFPTQPVVEVHDAGGNLVTGYTGSVAIAIGTNPGGGALAGTTTATVNGGKATFSGLSIDKIGTGYTLQASSAALTSATSSPFNITAGAATKLAFNPSPSNSQSQVAFPTQPVVEVQDAGGNLVTSYNGNVSLAIGANPGSGTLAGTTTVAVSGGKATFSGLNIDKSGAGYTLVASSGALTSATSSPFNITAGAAAKLVFNPSPSDSQSQVAFPTQPVVEARDAANNLASSYSGSVALAIGTNPSGGALAGTTTATFNGGKATFSGLSIDKVGAGYTLVASSAGLTSATSSAFDITKASATITLSNLNYTYDGNPHGASATTNPSGLAVVLTYTGATYGPSQTPPTQAGSYAVAASVNDPNYSGTASAILVIAKATATVTLSNLSYTYDGNPHGATVTTNLSSLSIAITYDGSNTVPTNAGSYAVVASVNDPNYAGTANATLTIAKATATVTLSNLSYTYDGSPHGATVTTTPSGLNVAITYNGSNATPTNAGSYAVVVAIADQNYQGSASGTLAIAKASQTITFAALPDKVYGDPPFAIVANASSALAVTLTVSGACAITGATLTITGVGACNVTASQPGDINYTAAASVTQSFTIAQGSQTIVFGALPDRAISNSPFTISATSSAGLPISFSASGECTISGTTVTLTGLGSCTITASQPGSAFYFPATPVTHTFAIVDSFKSMVPFLVNRPTPELVGSFSLSGGEVVANSPVVLTVTITNTGLASASQFWVDFYINPAPAPTDTNQRWDQRCSMRPCYGIAWYVDGGLAPGQSITLTSTPDSYSAKYTRWVGAFPKGTKDLYLYVDSWNPGVVEGAVAEADETNNRAEYHVPPSAALERALDANSAITPEEIVPPRPARP
jgi:hypothetical protein